MRASRGRRLALCQPARSNQPVGRPASIDRAEIESLYRRYGALVRRRARSILGDDHEAQDAMQEVFVRVIAAMAEFRGQSQPSTWLYRITTNLCLNRIRDSRRRRDRLTEAAEHGRDPLAPSASPPPEARTALQTVLRLVSEDLAQVAVFYYVDDMDQAEIATVLGVSRRTIGYRLDRFREQAQRILGETSGVAAEGPSGVPKAEGESG
jgi:RNA polymerase sigma-70 factor (ECF subfamily)